jgi:hypothetical protein
VGEQRANKLEKVFEKCERLDGKVGHIGGTGGFGAKGGGIVPCIAVQRYF